MPRDSELDLWIRLGAILFSAFPRSGIHSKGRPRRGLQIFHVPQHDCFSHATANLRAVACREEAHDRLRVALEHAQAGAHRQIPHPYRGIFRAANEATSSAHHTDACDRIAVALQREQQLAVVSIPHAHCLVVRAREELAAVGRLAHVVDRLRVLRERHLAVALARIPHEHSVVLRPRV